MLHHYFFFFFNDTATTEIYTLSLHDALPISCASTTSSPLTRSLSGSRCRRRPSGTGCATSRSSDPGPRTAASRSEEHTSELQSRQYLVCRLLLEKKKTHSNKT